MSAEPGTRARALPFAFAAAALLLLLGWLARETLWRSDTAGLDRRASLAVLTHHSPGRTRLAEAVSLLADHLVLLPATALVAGLLAKRGRRRAALAFVGVVAGGFVTSTLLKLSFHRARPDLWPALAIETTYSFPSGHTTMAAVFYGSLAVLVFEATRSAPARAAAVLGAAVLVLAVAFTRVYLGAHWLTDVAAGALAGASWVLLAVTLRLSARR